MTLVEMIREAMSDGAWWTPHQLIKYLRRAHDRHVSDSSVTARIRDLRKREHGEHVIRKRPIEGANGLYYAYRMRRRKKPKRRRAPLRDIAS